MMAPITKKQFLAAVACPVRGWLLRHAPAQGPLGPAEELRVEEGLEIHHRARKLFPEGIMVTGDNETCVRRTQELLSKAATEVTFEGTFVHEVFVAKADILIRRASGWKLLEVKSDVNDNEELIDDLSYTTFAALKAGLPLSSCCLLLVNRAYRLGMSTENLLTEIDHTKEALARAAEFEEVSDEIAKALTGNMKPPEELRWECKGCEFFRECVGHGIEHHIFTLPRISHTRFCQLRDMGVDSIEDIPADFKLTELQSRVRQAVKTGVTCIDVEGLRCALRSIRYPAHYLDFETVQTCVPLYKDIAPYEQLVTQYSLHICDEQGEVLEHREFLADPLRDCRRTLAENLLQDCGRKGSIVVYTAFEKTIITGLARSFPDLGDDLDGLIRRLYDLCDVLREYLYHPEFHGSFSIKQVLPAVAPFMTYGGMAVENGLDASAMFAFMARGRYRGRQAKKVRRDMLEYCRMDTLAMVTVVDVLRTMLRRMDEEGGERVAV